MKANKFQLDVQCYALSKDVFEGMLMKVLEELNNNTIGGLIDYDDGDTLMWKIQSEEVEF